MKILIDGNQLYIDNKRFCYAKVNDVEPGEYKVSTQYSHAHGRILPILSDCGWVGDDDRCALRIGSVLGSDGPIKCAMSIGGLVARLEAAEEFGSTILIEIK